MGLDISTLDENHPLRKKVEAADGKKSTRKKKNADPEHTLQVEAVEVFQYAFAKHRRKLFAIPNGGARHPVVAGKLKAEGVMPGVWDLFLAVPVAEYGGCFIETKVQGRKLTDEQIAFRSENEKDYGFFVYRTVTEFITGVKHYLEQKPNHKLHE